MKNAHLSDTVFQVLKVLLIQCYQIQLPVPLFLIVLHHLFSQILLEFHSTLFNILSEIFLFNEFTQIFLPKISQNLLSVTKVFC